MVDPHGIASDDSDDTEIYFSVTHRDFSSALRFMKRISNLQELVDTMNSIVKIYDEKIGEVWSLPQTRLVLNTLVYNRLYIQGTKEGLGIAKNILGLTVNEQKRDRPVKKPRL